MFRTFRHAIVAVVATALLCLAAPSIASACPNAGDDLSAGSVRASEAVTFCLINRERTTRGLRALRRNKRLDLASRRHARSMAARNFFAHGNFVGRIKTARYLKGARSWRLGENIAWGSGVLGTPGEIVDAWMHSPGHRANILSRGFREIGVGIAYGTPSGSYGDGGTYVTDFGTRG
jgi:uncharacterized protein YkwD